MRLLVDGDGLGDDRRLNMLLKVLRCRQVFTEYVPEGIAGLPTASVIPIFYR